MHFAHCREAVLEVYIQKIVLQAINMFPTCKKYIWPMRVYRKYLRFWCTERVSFIWRLSECSLSEFPQLQGPYGSVHAMYVYSLWISWALIYILCVVIPLWLSSCHVHVYSPWDPMCSNPLYSYRAYTALSTPCTCTCTYVLMGSMCSMQLQGSHGHIHATNVCNIAFGSHV